jgi:hypothetical protein
VTVTRPVLVYNVERLFRPGARSGPARSLGATPAQGWTRDVYEAKVAAVAAVAADATGGTRPALWFLIEVEDAETVADVCAAAGWPELVNVTVPDEHVDGYDVAIAYDPERFDGVRSAETHQFSNRFTTRDLVVATLSVRGGRDLVVANTHWASRRMPEGLPLRHAAAFGCTTVLEGYLKYRLEQLIGRDGRPRMRQGSTMRTRWETPMLVAGDFNDGPWDDTVRGLLRSTSDAQLVTRSITLPDGNDMEAVARYLSIRARLWNPTWALAAADPPRGTYVFDAEFTPLDQILCSPGLMSGRPPRITPGSLRVHAPRTVTAADGSEVAVRTRGGRPISFSIGSKRGVSDHLPLVVEVAFPN